jgi:hypothetical protein
MKDASKTSNARLARSRTATRPEARPESTSAAAREARRLRRKASRWLDLLAVYTTNAVPRDRWSGQRAMTSHEALVFHEEAMRRLERSNPAFFRAVIAAMQENAAAQNHLSYDEWKVVANASYERTNRLRRAIGRRNRSLPDTRKVY